MTNSIREVGDAACIFAIGSNTTTSHPIVGLEVIRSKRQGGKLIVANPRRIDLCVHADIFMQLKPGTNIPLLMGMMKVILNEGLEDKEFIKERTVNIEELKKAADGFDLDSVQEITGVPKETITAAARMYAENRPASILYAMGITQHTHGTDNVMATANLAMLTGNVGKESAGVNPLRGQNNVQGACDLGALPNVYPGYQKVDDPEVKKKFEIAWKTRLSDKVGLTHVEMFDAICEGRVKAMYQVGENPILSEANANHVKEAMDKLDFFVVQDIFLTESAQYADVVLPAAAFSEKDGTFTNTERRVQRVRKAIPPAGESKGDWQITSEIAKRMGAQGFDFKNASEVMDEIASLTPIYGGISYERIEQTGIQWPCPDTSHPGTQFLYADGFKKPDGKGVFRPLSYRPSAELPDDDYPLILTTERSLFHFHTATMSRKVDGLNILRKEELVEMNPADAERLGIEDGDNVKVTSRRGEVGAHARVTEVSPPGVVSMTFHFAESPTNELTNSALDPVAKIPETKVCAVKVEKT
jgi:formate dehydrogenase alpha subunit